eukprot:1149555-Pelagomonas_calceolata.AAC.4
MHDPRWFTQGGSDLPPVENTMQSTQSGPGFSLVHDTKQSTQHGSEFSAVHDTKRSAHNGPGIPPVRAHRCNVCFISCGLRHFLCQDKAGAEPQVA